MAPVPTEVKYDGGGGEESRSALADQNHTSNGNDGAGRQHCVVVGLGMVGIAFVEKLLKGDMDGGRDEWMVTV